LLIPRHDTAAAGEQTRARYSRAGITLLDHTR
jgi:hypothetical protein